MFERMQRSWRLFQEAWAVLRQDRELLWFPVFSGIASLLVMVSFAVPVVLSIPWGEITRGGRVARELPITYWHYGLGFFYYLISYFVIVFFNSALVACVRMRFQGENPTVNDGMAFARSNAGRIFQWALIAATVGMILRAIEERAEWIGRIVAGLIGMVWTLATTFVVPVLVYERVDPFEAIKRSAEAFKKTWGESVVGNAGIGFVFGLLFLPAVLILVAGIAAAISIAPGSGQAALGVLLTAVAVALIYGLALAIVQTALQGIFVTACYHYATTGSVPSVFSRELIADAWSPKK